MNDYYRIDHIKEKYRTALDEPDMELPEKVQLAINCIHSHLFTEKLMVEWMKNQCGINGKNFAAKFALYTGFTPKKYILHHRLQVSKKLLKQKNLKITVVAISIGFKSLSSFDKIFKNRFKVRPSDWRKHARYK